ncbi:hypothetical protein [Pelagibacterium lacus]|uniref:Uncharacterized protein n=1 Tax=Pelagibacterium lacus TaxID=2282655 RepID=A0A369W0T4_9HYPH|nr:hypothetical protein [Pelagibacterium lacus]RDE07649.1 hypothetical protein DVH29_15655 [Pelagibacterium lacus]
MKPLIVSAAALFASATLGWGVSAADLAAQLDAVASAVNAEDLEAIGCPDDPAEIIADLDGQWFMLGNAVRNWGTEGVGFGPEDLERSQTRNCSDGADSTFYRVIGDTEFTVREVLPSYDTELTQTLIHIEGRRFSVSVDIDELMRSYGQEDASETVRAEMEEMVALLEEQGIEFWRPSADILIAAGPFGIDVSGRCPAS